MVKNQIRVLGTILGGMATLFLALSGLGAQSVHAAVPEGNKTAMQCPNDIDYPQSDGTRWSVTGIKGPDDIDWNGDGIFNGVGGVYDPTAVCIRVGVTDGYTHMNGMSDMYIFGFVSLQDIPEKDLYNFKGHAHLPAPMIDVREGQKLYLTETNLGLGARPDIFDPHTVHFHGFPHAMAIFDGVPEPSIAVPPNMSFTYFYKLNDPGTYPYHCHQEPIEHIQMGMTGMLVVRPKQDADSHFHPVLNTGGFAYNDGATVSGGIVTVPGVPDTHYDVVYNIFIDDEDTEKHHHNETIQEAGNQWHTYKPTVNTLNGRIYPDTLLPDGDLADLGVSPTWPLGDPTYSAQRSSLMTASSSQRVLIRLVSLGYRSHTFTIPGMAMHVIGEDAKILRGPTGVDTSYMTNTFEIAGGKSAEIILEPNTAAPGTYYFMARELNQQSSMSLLDLYADRDSGQKDAPENYNGMMTEIHITN